MAQNNQTQKAQIGFASIVFLCLTQAFGLTSVADAQTRQTAVTAEAGEVSKTDFIKGKVVNESGQPLANATVQVRAVGSRGIGQVTTTNRDGVFKVSGLERLPYNVFASLPAYAPKPRESESGSRAQYRAGDSVTFVLIKGGVITGTVTRSNGDPVVTIGVRARMIRDQNGRSINSEDMSRESSTDDRGVYRIYGLSPGTYIVVADGLNDYSQTGVNAFAADVPTYASSSNRETAEEITVRSGEETSNVDIRYRGERGRIISGTVNGPGNEEQGYSVVLNSIGVGEPQWTGAEHGSREFAFEGIADGDYLLVAISSLKDGERRLSESRLINVRGADIGGIELTPAPLASISGRVVLEESKAPECTDKRPPLVSETFISAWHKETAAAKRQPRFVWSIGEPASPNAQWNFTMRNLAPSQYYFAARFSAKDWYVQSITFPPSPVNAKTASTAKPIDATRTWTTVKTGDRLSGLMVTLAQGAGSLSGQILVGEGEAVPEKLFVYLVPAEREKADDALRYFAAAVTPDGKIALNNLAPGRYWIIARPAIDDLGVPDATETRSMLRRSAEAAKNEIEFKPCQNVVDFRLKL